MAKAELTDLELVIKAERDIRDNPARYQEAVNWWNTTYFENVVRRKLINERRRRSRQRKRLLAQTRLWQRQRKPLTEEMQSLLQQQRERESELRQCVKSAQGLRRRLKKIEDELRQRKKSPNERQLKEMAGIRRLLKTYEHDVRQRRQDRRRGEIRRRNVGIRALQPAESEKRVRCYFTSRVLEAMNTFLPYNNRTENRHIEKIDAARIVLLTVLISRPDLKPREIGLHEDTPWKDGLVGGRNLADLGIAEQWNGEGEEGANAVWYDLAKDAWLVLDDRPKTAVPENGPALSGGAPSAAAGEPGRAKVLAGQEPQVDGNAVVAIIAERAGTEPRLMWLRMYLDGNPNATLREIEGAAGKAGHSLPKSSVNDILRHEKWIGHPPRGKRTKTRTTDPDVIGESMSDENTRRSF